jgi:hypothetical protein
MMSRSLRFHRGGRLFSFGVRVAIEVFDAEFELP